MHRTVFSGVLAVALVTGLGLLAPTTGSAATSSSGSMDVRQVASFPAGVGGSFAESMAAGPGGTFVVGLTTWGVPLEDGSWTPNVGQIYRVRPNGARTAFGPAADLGGAGMAMGVVVDEKGQVFVAVTNFGGLDGLPDPASLPTGVYRVTGSAWTRVLTLPGDQVRYANGLTIRDGMFYLTDSYDGSIWRGPVDRPSAPEQPWFSSDLLAPSTAGGLGANGIAYRHGSFYVVNYEQGVIVRIPVGRGGQALPATVFASSPLLATGDGIAFDGDGRLWVAVNGTIDWDSYSLSGSGLAVVDRQGHVTEAAVPDGSLVYPTQPLPVADGTVYVLNGDYLSWADLSSPAVVALTT